MYKFFFLVTVVSFVYSGFITAQEATIESYSTFPVSKDGTTTERKKIKYTTETGEVIIFKLWEEPFGKVGGPLPRDIQNEAFEKAEVMPYQVEEMEKIDKAYLAGMKLRIAEALRDGGGALDPIQRMSVVNELKQLTISRDTGVSNTLLPHQKRIFDNVNDLHKFSNNAATLLAKKYFKELKLTRSQIAEIKKVEAESKKKVAERKKKELDAIQQVLKKQKEDIISQLDQNQKTKLREFIGS